MAINAYFHITAAGAGDNSGDTWANAMDEPAFETHLEGAVVAGDVHFVMDGSYTLDSTIDASARDGTAVSPIAIIGVKTGTTNEGSAVVYSDWSIDAADRPFFDGVTFGFLVGDFYIIRNIDHESSATSVVSVGLACNVVNCKFNNDNGISAAKHALDVGEASHIIDNEITAANVSGMNVAGAAKVLYNYIHDCPDASNGYGVINNGQRTVYAFNIFDQLEYGILAASDEFCLCLNNTFYECDTGIRETNAYGWAVINNIFDNIDTVALSWTTQTDINFFWKNHEGNSVVDYAANVDETTVFQDYEKTTGDPEFITPGSEFDIEDTSPCYGTAQGVEKGIS